MNDKKVLIVGPANEGKSILLYDDTESPFEVVGEFLDQEELLKTIEDLIKIEPSLEIDSIPNIIKDVKEDKIFFEPDRQLSPKEYGQYLIKRKRGKKNYS